MNLRMKVINSSLISLLKNLFFSKNSWNVLNKQKPRNDNEVQMINYLWMKRNPLENNRNGKKNKQKCPQICNCRHMHVRIVFKNVKTDQNII